MRTLYHVTTRTAGRSIGAEGYVLPSKSEGKRLWSYWVSERELDWALSHVSARRDVPVSALVVVVALHEEEDLIRTARTGVYARDVPVQVTDIRPVKRMIDLDEEKD